MKYFFLICCLFCTSLSAQPSDYDRAWAAYTSGQYEEALVAIEQCIVSDSSDHRYIFLKGRTLENLYRYDDAIAVQYTALRMNPESVEARAALAALYYLSGQPAVSAQYYEQLATAEPQINRWKISWATALMSAGNYQDALEQLTIVENADSTNWLVYKYMGDCFYRLNKNWGTFNHYQYALKLYPNNKNLWGTFTRLLAINNETEAAITIGTEAVAIDSTNMEAWKYLGIALYKSGDSRRTHHALGKALALGDSSYLTISHYGVINYHLAQNRSNYLYYREAEKYLEKARQLDANDINIMNYLAATYGYTGKSQKGLDILDEIDVMVASFDSVGMKSNIQRGHLLRRLNRNNEAANAFITAIKDFPKDFQNFYEVAICYDRGSSKKLAIDWYTRYLEKIDVNWATKKWTEQELREHEFVSAAMERIQSLKEDLFWEEEKRK